MQPRAISRRALLGITAVTLVACGKKRKVAAPPPVVVPDAAALTDARNAEIELIAWYDAAIARASVHRRPALQVERAIHTTHRDALHGSAPAPTNVPVIANLRTALRTSVRQLRVASLAATNGNNAALLASIAASHEASLP